MKLTFFLAFTQNVRLLDHEGWEMEKGINIYSTIFKETHFLVKIYLKYLYRSNI